MAGSILIVDDVSTNRIVLKAMLSGARYATCQAANGAEALRIARREHPGLILLDVDLPDMSGRAVIAALREDPQTRRIPIVAVSTDNSPEARLDLLQSGASDILVKPFNELVMLARLRSLLRQHGADEEFALRETTCRELGFAEEHPAFARRARIALIAAKRSQAMRWKSQLTPILPDDQIEILGREETLARAVSNSPFDAFVIAADLSQPGEGLRLLTELRSRLETRHAVIMIAADTADGQATALDLGANDLFFDTLSGMVTPREVALRLRMQLNRKHAGEQQRAVLDAGLRLALVDPLTGLYNRRYASSHLARMSNHALRTGRTFAVMLLDLDRFKSVNDTYGHSAGDEVLTTVADRLRGHLRANDLIARIGGEEFLVAMPDTTLEEARAHAERLRRLIGGSSVLLQDGRKLNVTISIGLALGGLHDEDPRDLVDQADIALLGSKATGRNQVTIARHDSAA